MKLNQNNMTMMDETQFDVLKNDLSAMLNKDVVVTVSEGQTRNSIKKIVFKGELISVSNNVFSIKAKLGKYNFIMKSFQLNDLAINKISVVENTEA